MPLTDYFHKIKSTFGGEKQKYSIGYQMRGDYGDTDFPAMVDKYRDRISEVFFPMPGDSSGRPPIGSGSKKDIMELLAVFCKDLDALHEIGVPGVLLFNSACYGGNAVSYGLFNHVKDSIEMVRKHIDLIALTTMSMPIAEFVKMNFKELPVRASVNMYLEDVGQMSLASRYFDGFYLGREVNRDMARIKRIREWCDAHGKSLHLLANSGCLHHCPFKHFHLNASAHYRDLEKNASPTTVNSFLCARELANPENHVCILRSSWIRPEDIHHYAGMFDTIKLATRSAEYPENVLKAYCDEKWNGDLLEILEPGHSNVQGSPVFCNDRFPKDWFDHTAHCGHHCETCHYCEEVLQKVVSG